MRQAFDHMPTDQLRWTIKGMNIVRFVAPALMLIIALVVVPYMEPDLPVFVKPIMSIVSVLGYFLMTWQKNLMKAELKKRSGE